MKERTKLLLGAAAAMVVLPALAFVSNMDDVKYIADDGSDKVTAAALLKGKRPKSFHLTVTKGVHDDDAGVEYVVTKNGSVQGRWYYRALRSEGDEHGLAPVLLVTKSPFLSGTRTSWSGVWTNGDTGINQEVADLFKQQGVSFKKDALVLDLDSSRQSKIVRMGAMVGGAFAVPLLVLVIFALTLKDEDKEEKKLEGAKQRLAGDVEATRMAIRRAIAPYLTDPDVTVQVRGNVINRSTPECVLARDEDESPAPPELQQLLMQFHSLLKKNKVSYAFMTYTAFHDDSEGWKDSFEFS